MAIDFLAHVRSESARFRDVLAAADPAARVPTCPDWSADDLLWHLTEVQGFWGAIVRDKLDDPRRAQGPEPADGHEALLAGFDEATTVLVEALAGTADEVPVWTWFPTDHSVGFVRRRQAHEALIHRLDAELTAGELTAVDPALATDGVLEVLEWMYGVVPTWAEHAVDGPVGRVSTSDTGASWLVQLGRWSGHSPSSGKDYTDERSISVVDEGEPAFAVSGTARDLDAWLWNRPTLAEVRVEGDAEPFVDLIRTGVQ